MPEYQAPGVYIEEVPSGHTPIEGVPTSVAGFVGQAERGPTAPQRLQSWPEFQKVYGGEIAESHLAHAVHGFFGNGGERCWVARVVAVNGGALKSEPPVVMALNMVFPRSAVPLLP